jgi:predicted O-methyltransferase YrrM
VLVPWPIRPMIDYSRRRRVLRDGLKAVSGCSDALGPVKNAFARALRWPSPIENAAFSAIDQRWHDLSKSPDVIRVIGDSVPPHLLGQTVPVAEHTMNTSTRRPWGDVLFQLVRVLQPTAVLELGTCVGMSGAYLASAMRINNKGHLYTLEGMPDSASVARETFSALGVSERVTIIVGRFNDTLGDAFKHAPYNLAFIDGHHEGDATVEYFQKIKPNMTGRSFLIFDDIDWSRGMQAAWKFITQDRDVRDHVAIMGWGILSI